MADLTLRKEDFDKYKIFTPIYDNEEDKMNDDPICYDWKWKPNTPQDVIDEYNDRSHYWNHKM